MFVNFYCGSVVYTGSKAVEYVAHSEGIAHKSGSSFTYQYNQTDHLGNVRSVADASKAVVQATDYFPFGLAHSTSNLTKNKYLYNGKELQNDVVGGTPFGQLDYGARMYDATLGIWHSIDPLAEEHYDYTPYAYVYNNPTNFIDIFGLDTVSVHDVDWHDFNPDKDVIQLDNVVVNSSKEIKDIQVMKPVENFWGWTNQFLFGNREYGGWEVNTKGNLTGFRTPIIGTVPTPGKSEYIKGIGKISANLFHRTIKQKILQKAKDYVKIVGNNPDIEVVAGKIILKGVGPFKNKIFKTTLKASDYF